MPREDLYGADALAVAEAGSVRNQGVVREGPLFLFAFRSFLGVC